MEQVRIFHDRTGVSGLEKRINEWLANAGEIQITGRLLDTTGKELPYITIAIFYIDLGPKKP